MIGEQSIRYSSQNSLGLLLFLKWIGFPGFSERGLAMTWLPMVLWSLGYRPTKDQRRIKPWFFGELIRPGNFVRSHIILFIHSSSKSWFRLFDLSQSSKLWKSLPAMASLVPSGSYRPPCPAFFTGAGMTQDKTVEIVPAWYFGVIVPQ
jgi:hypothetical protein